MTPEATSTGLTAREWQTIANQHYARLKRTQAERDSYREALHKLLVFADDGDTADRREAIAQAREVLDRA